MLNEVPVEMKSKSLEPINQSLSLSSYYLRHWNRSYNDNAELLLSLRNFSSNVQTEWMVKHLISSEPLLTTRYTKPKDIMIKIS